VPILAAFKKWLDHHLLKTSEQGVLGKAIRYCLSHWHKLNNYLRDGRIEIDNNWDAKIGSSMEVQRVPKRVQHFCH